MPFSRMASFQSFTKSGTDAVLRCYLSMRLSSCERFQCYLFLELGGVATSLVYFFVLHVCVLVGLYTLTILCTRKRGIKLVSKNQAP